MGYTFSKLFENAYSIKKQGILLLGLKDSGKTTILQKLKLGECVTTIPTIGFHINTVEHKNIVFTSWNVGDDFEYTVNWKAYENNTTSIVFVVDSNNRNRILEARAALQKLIQRDEFQDLPLLVFANKQDLSEAMSSAEVVDKLGLMSLRNRTWYIQSSCATSGDGLYEGLEWLAEMMKKRQ